MRSLIGLGVKRDAFCDVVVHTALHEAVMRLGMLHLGHVLVGSGGLLRETSRTEQK